MPILGMMDGWDEEPDCDNACLTCDTDYYQQCDTEYERWWHEERLPQLIGEQRHG